MTKIKLSSKAVTLAHVGKTITKEERQYIEAEKAYYHMVVAFKKEREDQGLTQEKLAEISRLPRTTITKIESGSRNTTVQTLLTLAHAMGKNIELKLV